MACPVVAPRDPGLRRAATAPRGSTALGSTVGVGPAPPDGIAVTKHVVRITRARPVTRVVGPDAGHGLRVGLLALVGELAVDLVEPLDLDCPTLIVDDCPTLIVDATSDYAPTLDRIAAFVSAEYAARG